jgi:hypothetical protein
MQVVAKTKATIENCQFDGLEKTPKSDGLEMSVRLA